MPRGIPKSKEYSGAMAMSKEEMEAAEERVAGKVSPLREEEFSAPKGETYETPDGRQITKVGNFRAMPQIGDAQTLSRFAKIEREEWDGWIEMTPAEARAQQSMGTLAGYDQDKQLGLLRKLGRVKK